MGNAQAMEQGSCGYRVLGVQPNSPASKVGLVSFFDFIVAADGEFNCPAMLHTAVYSPSSNCAEQSSSFRVGHRRSKKQDDKKKPG